MADLFAPLPNKLFEIIMADPPWHYENPFSPRNNGLYQSAEDHYPTVGLEELKTLPVKDIAAKNCLLYMWTTTPKLDESIELGTAWGFKYRQVAFVWHKQNKILGSYSLTSCELVLVFKRGNIPSGKGVKGIEQFLSLKAGKHSVKPAEIRDRINKMYPSNAKIELFARPPKNQLIRDDSYKSWDTWGNEA